MSQVAISGNASGTGTLTIAAPNTNSNYTLNLPAETGTLISTASTFAGTGPAFSAYQSSAQTLSSSTSTKITYDVEEFDTNSNFASSRFTPTVAGYYNFSAAIQMGVLASIIVLTFFKNGSAAKVVGQTSTSVVSLINGSALIYCNGTTDYVEVYAQLGTGQALYATSSTVYFQGVMVRAA